jgi:hypothetical protein
MIRLPVIKEEQKMKKTKRTRLRRDRSWLDFPRHGSASNGQGEKGGP